MKGIKKVLCSFLAVCLSALCFVSCTDKPKSYQRKNDDYLLAICEACYDINTEVENTLTTEYVSEVAGVFGAKSYRLWMHFSRVLTRDPKSNEVLINEVVAEKFHNLIASLKAQGVERFICMTSNYLHPLGYDPTTAGVVPDPLTEPDAYEEFLDLFEECFRVLAVEFPEIDYFEPTNEPDILNGQNICKNGYQWGGTDNGEYIYSMVDGAHIVADMSYRVTRAVKAVDKKNTVLLPALCGYSSTVYYLDEIYKAIKSRTLPTGEKKADTNPDHYFEILNWHPYLLGEGEPVMNQGWVNLQKRIFAVAEGYGDGDSPVWFTEMGFTDIGNKDYQQEMADNMTKLLNYLKTDLKFVETVFVFRITNLTGYAVMNEYENNFGLFYSLNDPDEELAGKPKPIAIALYQFFKGKDADLSPLYSLGK